MPPIQLPQAVLDYAAIHNNLAVKLYDEKKRDTAIVMARRSLAINPFDENARVNLGIYLAWTGGSREARALADSVIADNPNNPNAWSLTSTLDLIDGKDGLEAAQKAHDLDPKTAQRKFDLACAHLRLGNFAKGWELFEARKDIDHNNYVPPSVPVWNGERVKHLLVYSEQGMGDRVQFARYLPVVAKMADKVSFAVDNDSALLFSHYNSVCRVMVPGPDLDQGGYDAQIALLSLPMVLGTDIDSIPPAPYQYMPVGDTRGALAGDGLKVGLCWAGNPKHANDIVRSMPFETLLPLTADLNCSFFGMQVGPRSADIHNARAGRLVNDLSGLIEGDVYRAPTLIANLDLIVTVDSGLAHLAASIGKPVFMMVSRFNDWRWMLDRTDTPWYPSMRLFRQDRLGDWAGVVRKVQAAIDDMNADRLKREHELRESANPSMLRATVEAA